MPQYQENATVVRVERFAFGNCRLTLHSPQVASVAQPGQFVMVKAGLGKDPLLRRPFSLHQVVSGGTIQIYFKVVGKGTEILAEVNQHQQLSVLGPLGRGFRIDAERPAVIVAGGLGVAPMLFLAGELCRKKTSTGDDLLLLGARQRGELEPLLGDFRELGLNLLCSSDDGSLGRPGFVTDLLQTENIAAESLVYACGPEPMLARTVAICRSKSLACQVSVETSMACGMGACLGCNRHGADGSYTHVCLDGPVYDAEELLWTL
jgi:dihydroorotate dehydrogenase electron transfer subunit